MIEIDIRILLFSTVFCLGWIARAVFLQVERNRVVREREIYKYCCKNKISHEDAWQLINKTENEKP